MAGAAPDVRIVFTVDSEREAQNSFSIRLH